MNFHTDLSKAIARMIALVVVLVSTAGCGSGFVKGWRDNTPKPSGIPSSVVCEQQDGYSWVNGECVEDSGLDLNGITTEEQCASIKNAYWVDNKCSFHSALTETQCSLFPELLWFSDKCMLREEAECSALGKFYKEGKCYDRPVITFTGGSRDQSLMSGAAFEPIQFTVTEGAIVRIADASCPGYFIVNGTQIIAKADVKPAEGQNTCKATLVADKNGIESDGHDIKVTFSEGFLAYCSNPMTTDIDVYFFALRLAEFVQAGTCEEASKSLAKQTILSLADRRIVRIDALFGLKNVRWLEITSHRIEDVKPIASLTGLVYLDLASAAGNIRDISALAKLPDLKRLILDGNPIANGTVAKTEANCPTAAGTNAAVKEFCENK